MSNEEGAADSGDFLDRIDEVLNASFPASDPPPWTLGYRSLVPTRPQSDGQSIVSDRSLERLVRDPRDGAAQTAHRQAEN